MGGECGIGCHVAVAGAHTWPTGTDTDWRLETGCSWGNGNITELHIRSQAWEECRLRGDEDPSSWQGYNHAGGFCFIIHACIILLCCNVVSGNLPFCRHYNPTITRSRPVASRASNEHSRRFHNHGEGQHFTLLTFKRLLAIKTKWAPPNGQVALSIFIFISSVSASRFHIYIQCVNIYLA